MTTEELLDREFVTGTRVTNCVVHMHMDFKERPDNCKLCLTDLRNHLAHAVRVNEWLNTWKDDATKILLEK